MKRMKSLQFFIIFMHRSAAYVCASKMKCWKRENVYVMSVTRKNTDSVKYAYDLNTWNVINNSPTPYGFEFLRLFGTLTNSDLTYKIKKWNWAHANLHNIQSTAVSAYLHITLSLFFWMLIQYAMCALSEKSGLKGIRGWTKLKIMQIDSRLIIKHRKIYLYVRIFLFNTFFSVDFFFA